MLFNSVTTLSFQQTEKWLNISLICDVCRFSHCQREEMIYITRLNAIECLTLLTRCNKLSVALNTHHRRSFAMASKT